jgi:hypothetical protein
MTSREGFSFLPPPSCSSPRCPLCPSRLLLSTRLPSPPSSPLCVVKLCLFYPSYVSRLPRFACSFVLVLPLHTGSCTFSLSLPRTIVILSSRSFRQSRSLLAPLVTFPVSVGFPSLPRLRSSLLPSVFSCFLGLLLDSLGPKRPLFTTLHLRCFSCLRHCYTTGSYPCLRLPPRGWPSALHFARYLPVLLDTCLLFFPSATTNRRRDSRSVNSAVYPFSRPLILLHSRCTSWNGSVSTW